MRARGPSHELANRNMLGRVRATLCSNERLMGSRVSFASIEKSAAFSGVEVAHRGSQGPCEPRTDGRRQSEYVMEMEDGQ